MRFDYSNSFNPLPIPTCSTSYNSRVNLAEHKISVALDAQSFLELKVLMIGTITWSATINWTTWIFTTLGLNEATCRYNKQCVGAWPLCDEAAFRVESSPNSGVRFTELELLLMRFKFNCNLKLGVGFTKLELLVYNEVGTSTSFLTVGASPHIGQNPTYAVTAAMPQMSLDCTSYWM